MPVSAKNVIVQAHPKPDIAREDEGGRLDNTSIVTRLILVTIVGLS